MKNKTYHTFRTVPKYNDKQDIPHLQEQFLNIMKNKTYHYLQEQFLIKTYHTFRTVPKYNDKQDIPHLQEQFLNIMINKTYHTFRTVPKYYDKQDIPHLHNSLSLYLGTVMKVWYVLFIDYI